MKLNAFSVDKNDTEEIKSYKECLEIIRQSTITAAKLGTSSANQEMVNCKVCQENVIAVIFQPCGHLTCMECRSKSNVCPRCN